MAPVVIEKRGGLTTTACGPTRAWATSHRTSSNRSRRQSQTSRERPVSKNAWSEEPRQVTPSKGGPDHASLLPYAFLHQTFVATGFVPNRRGHMMTTQERNGDAL